MATNIENSIRSIPGVENETAEQLISILTCPDDKFNELYPYLKESILKSYDSPSFQQDMLRQISVLPIGTVEENREAIKDFLAAFDEDDTLSDNKKELLHVMFDSMLDVYADLTASGRQTVKVKITKLNSEAIIPVYAHPTDAGCDLCAIEETTFEPNETKIVKTGLAVAIPAGYEIQVRPRSGMSLKTGLRVANAPGTIDADYRGEIGVIIHNTNSTSYTLEKGAKIAQLLIAPTPMIKWVEVESQDALGTTDRGIGGYGSTDNKS